MKLPANIDILLRATAFEKGKFRNIKLIGTIMPPPPIPPAIARANPTNMMIYPIISKVVAGNRGLCAHVPY